jgi:hypothetical protein
VKEGGQELLGDSDCTVHRKFLGSQVLFVEQESRLVKRMIVSIC